MPNEYGFDVGEIVEIEIPKDSSQWHFATLLEVGGGLVAFALEMPLQEGGYGTIGLSQIRRPLPEKLFGHLPSPYPWEKELKAKREERGREDEELKRRRLEEWEKKEWPEMKAKIKEVLGQKWWHCLRFWK